MRLTEEQKQKSQQHLQGTSVKHFTCAMLSDASGRIKKISDGKLRPNNTKHYTF